MNAQIDITETVLETERLLLRSWRENDLDDLFAYASSPEVGEMAGWQSHRSIDESKARLEMYISGKNSFALELKESGKVIGALGFLGSWSDGDGAYSDLLLTELGYELAKEHWGRGLMTEAVRRAVAFLFDELSLDAVTVGCSSDNTRSCRVIEKCGFRFVKDSVYHADQLKCDFSEKCYILFREEWKSNR